MEHDIRIEQRPELKEPILIAGFEGWGNALDVANGLIAYLIRKLDAGRFASMEPDPFYRFDEIRPTVVITEGQLKTLAAPGGVFYAAKNDFGNNDLVIFKAQEPHLGWFRFVGTLLDFCENLEIHGVITLGSMFDTVLHTDRTVSGIATEEEDFQKLKDMKVLPINYSGPSAIHSLIHAETAKRSLKGISLWSHCPYYLQNAVHFGAMSHLGRLLSDFIGFKLDTEELEAAWERLSENIQKLIDENPKLQNLIDTLRREKVRGSWQNVKATLKSGDNVINLSDFFENR